jgi:cytochrome P450
MSNSEVATGCPVTPATPSDDGVTLAEYPVPRTDSYELPAEYAELRRERPVSRVRMWSGEEVWLVTRHEDVRAVLADNRFSADNTRSGFPRYRKGFPRLAASGTQSIVSKADMTFMRMDPPEHDRIRRMLMKEFTVRRAEAMRPRVQAMVDGFVDDLLAAEPPGDLIRSLAVPLPSLVMCELLAVPFEDREFFQDRSAVVMSGSATQRQSLSALRAMVEYFEQLVSAKEADPGDDLISRLVVDHVRPGLLTHGELVSTARLLLIAGHETTGSMIGLAFAALLAHPDQLELLRAEPELIPGAVEELLRHFGITEGGIPRVAIEDVELGGVSIRAGDGVVASLAAANRDEARFERPDDLDVTRSPRGHVAFGFGVHQCIGQALARVELQVAVATVLRRLPVLRLAVPPEEVPFRRHTIIYGVEELPVTW